MAGELSLPEAGEIARLLTRRIRRGIILWNVLRLAAGIGAGIEFIEKQYVAAIGALFIGILFGVALDHVKRRSNCALLIVRNPQLVYWAHPTRVTEAMARHPAGNIAPLTVHLRNGDQFEATLAPAEQKQFVDWLSRANPTLRWGPYDDISVSNLG